MKSDVQNNSGLVGSCCDSAGLSTFLFNLAVFFIQY